MPGLDDCYVFVEQRDAQLVRLFLDEFLPEREEIADYYHVPQYSDDPDKVFESAFELIDFLCDHPEQTHAIYWNSKRDTDPRNAMVFFTKDGGMILGLSCNTDSGYATTFLQHMKEFLLSDLVYIAFEEPPPDTKAEFIRRVMKYES